MLCLASSRAEASALVGQVQLPLWIRKSDATRRHAIRWYRRSETVLMLEEQNYTAGGRGLYLVKLFTCKLIIDEDVRAVIECPSLKTGG